MSGRIYVAAAATAFLVGALAHGPHDAEAKRGEVVPAGWRHVPQSLADSLAESGAPDADTYPWETCITNWHRSNEAGMSRLVCPNGYTERW